jgi:hypothetical protein
MTSVRYCEFGGISSHSERLKLHKMNFPGVNRHIPYRQRPSLVFCFPRHVQEARR